jgi:hypothetical protein
MYTHNGFGNQLYQVAFGYMLAESLGRNLHIADVMPKYALNPTHPNKYDPNSWGGYAAGRHVLNISRVDEMWVSNHCNGSNLTYSERKSDKKSHSSRLNMLLNNEGWIKILTFQPKCIMLIGYWLNSQWISPFLTEIKTVFRDRLKALPQLKLNVSDIVIHIRCAEPHYVMLPMDYYDTILNNISKSTIWLATTPSCRKKKMVSQLISKYDMKFFNFSGKMISNIPNDARFLADFSLLVSAKRLILSPSTFSDWGGLLSNASEIHAPYFSKSIGGSVSQNWAPIWPSDNRYVYHDPFAKNYFGRYDMKINSVAFITMNSTLINSSFVFSRKPS